MEETQPTAKKARNIIDTLIANVFGDNDTSTEREDKLERIRNHQRFPGDRRAIPQWRRKGMKNAGLVLYKSAVCGMPRTTQPLGSVPAPTHDQVRRVEARYGQRLIVKRGLLHFMRDGHLFTNEEAGRRQHLLTQGDQHA